MRLMTWTTLVVMLKKQTSQNQQMITEHEDSQTSICHLTFLSRFQRSLLSIDDDVLLGEFVI